MTTENTGSVTGQAGAEVTGSTSTVVNAQPNWVESLANEELRGWAMNKGFQHKDPATALESYRGLEKLFGADKAGRTVVIPTNFDDPIEAGQFYEKLGRPKLADDYNIKIEGANEDFMKTAKGWFHEAGLPERQASILAAKYAEHEKTVGEQRTQETATKHAQEVQALKAEWGAAFDAHTKVVDLAAAKFGMASEQLEALKTAMGPAAAMKFLHNLGSKMGEDTMVGSGDKPGFGVMTPAQAKDQLSKHAGDPEFMKALTTKNHPRHDWAVGEKGRLTELMFAVAA